MNKKTGTRSSNRKRSEAPSQISSPVEVKGSPKKQLKTTKKSTRSTGPKISAKISDECISPALELDPESIKRLCLNLNETKEVYGYDAEMLYLTSILRSTIENGDSSSVLIVGGRGVGKTTLFNHSLKQFDVEANKCTVIRLNGIVHAKDLNSMKSIAEALNIEAVDLPEIIAGLKEKCQSEGLKVIIVLDEFDHFCRRHQTLLYNLLDAAQYTGSVCIIGMTSRLDCVELMEKRVKSRLNQRIINLNPPFKNQKEYFEFAKSILNNSISIEGDLKEALVQQYSINKSFRALKKLLIELLLRMKREKSFVNSRPSDVKLLHLSSLSMSELTVLLLSYKFVQDNHLTNFNCWSVLNLMFGVCVQVKLSQKFQLSVISRLIDYGLVVPVNINSTSKLYLTEWTPLALTVDKLHIKETLSNNSIPADIKLLVNGIV